MKSWDIGLWVTMFRESKRTNKSIQWWSLRLGKRQRRSVAAGLCFYNCKIIKHIKTEQQAVIYVWDCMSRFEGEIQSIMICDILSIEQIKQTATGCLWGSKGGIPPLPTECPWWNLAEQVPNGLWTSKFIPSHKPQITPQRVLCSGFGATPDGNKHLPKWTVCNC